MSSFLHNFSPLALKLRKEFEMTDGLTTCIKIFDKNFGRDMASGWESEGPGIAPRRLQATFDTGLPKNNKICKVHLKRLEKMIKLAINSKCCH